MLGKLVHIESEGFASSTETHVVVKKRFLSTEEDGRLGNKLNRAIATRCIEEEESSRFSWQAACNSERDEPHRLLEEL